LLIEASKTLGEALHKQLRVGHHRVEAEVVGLLSVLLLHLGLLVGNELLLLLEIHLLGHRIAPHVLWLLLLLSKSNGLS